MIKAIHTYVDMELAVKVMRMAQRRGMSLAQFMEELLKQEIEREENRDD